jgi:riboflavin kinase/FMN adenylyltransferase
MMKTISLTYPIEEQVKKSKQLSLAIGFFDGVHLGHQTVINYALQQAKVYDLIPAVMTFTPHPREVLGKQKFEGYLTPLEEKLKIFAKFGVEETYVVSFDQQFASLSREAFVSEVLVPLGVKVVTTGFNFTFGHFAKGKPSDLQRLGKSTFETMIMSPVTVNDQTVSSTRIREALSLGQAEEAKMLLGHPHRIAGEVIHGDKRGRLLGFPTANLALTSPFIIPQRGVYVVEVYFQDKQVYGMMNIGLRPTFNDPEPKTRLEVHLFDIDVDLYGQILEVEVLHHLRKEQKFSSIDALKSQLHADKADSITWIKQNQHSYLLNGSF